MTTDDPRNDSGRPAEPTSWSNQTPLQQGSARQWLIPATALAVIALVVFGFLLTLQLALPIVGIAFTVVMWVLMLLIARSGGDPRRRNRRLAWAMGGLAFGALAIAFGVYALETLGVAAS
ncbi:hypothetical protein [Microbacterium sp. GXF7504]